MDIGLVEGWTAPILVTLLTDGAALNLTGLTVALMLWDRDGHPVATPGAVTVVGPAANGQVQYAPAGTEWVADRAPYVARWRVTDGAGKVGYVPSDAPDRWTVRAR